MMILNLENLRWWFYPAIGQGLFLVSNLPVIMMVILVENKGILRERGAFRKFPIAFLR